MDTTQNLVHGAGLGLRRSFLSRIVEAPPEAVGFYEVAPENWITIGGKYAKQFRAMTERFDFICHGLSLSIGSTDPLDENFVREVKQFMAEHQIKFYSEHLSYCSKDGHLYDLMPIPFTSEAVVHVAGRIKRVQDILEQKIAIENVSYYAAPGQEMAEIDFFNAVIEEADCDVLAHIAGHYVEAEDFLVDTHGADVVDPVWKLLGKAYELYGVFPTLLERDFNIPAMEELIKEVNTISTIQKAWETQHAKQFA